MALTHRITRRIDLAHEPGEWIEVRLPSLAILDRAKEAQMRRALALVQGIDLSQIKGDGERQGGTDYDWRTLLEACVTAWSYAEPVSPENVAELDEATVQAVLAVLLPAETEDAQKKG